MQFQLEMKKGRGRGGEALAVLLSISPCSYAVLGEFLSLMTFYR